MSSKVEELQKATEKMKRTEYFRIRTQRECIDGLEARITLMETKLSIALNNIDTELANQKMHREKAAILLSRIESYLKEWI